jgi:hypothetical protein
LIANLETPITASARSGEFEIELLFERHFAAPLGRFRFSVSDRPATATELPARIDRAVNRLASNQSPIDRPTFRQLQRHFVRTSPQLKQQRKTLERLQRSLPEPVRTLVMRERDPDDGRTTYRHHRGEYLKTEEEVAPAVPSAFGELDPGQLADRLSLARWLVSEENPLVARVTVNRAWRAFFGTGIVRTAGDFGTQSEPPSHPMLIDWLAVDLRRGGWSMKRLHRQIVLSSTYRQAVGDSPASDPDNRLLSCFPHRRLSAEQIRDTMLSAAGMMTHRIGGPSVFPPQPGGVFEMAYGSPKWTTSTGADRYRRSLYTFSKRTAPFAAYLTFDGPTGEVCVARRDRSTTPLQALTLMNDAMYLEIAKGLADTAVREAGKHATPRQIAKQLFRRLLVRSPSRAELDAIVAFYDRQEEHTEPWMLVARALMNTDEAITAP